MKHAAAKPPRKKLAAAHRALFQQAAEALQQAAMTAEDHRHGGESDRLLRIASGVARSAAQADSSRDLQDMAFDVAACINAARLVPGHAESAPRSGLLGQAAQALSQISETPADHIVFPVPRWPGCRRRALPIPCPHSGATWPARPITRPSSWRRR